MEILAITLDKKGERYKTFIENNSHLDINPFQAIIGKNLTELKSSIRSLETQIIIIDDSIVSLENYKKQLNQVINEVQTEIVSIKEGIIKE